MKIAVSATSFVRNQWLCNRLVERFPNAQIVYCNPDIELKEPGLVKLYSGCIGAIVGKEPINASLLEKVPSLKAIAKYGVGLDNISFKDCRHFNVVVKHKAGINAQAVAEHTIGLMIGLLRNVCKTDRLLHQGIWQKNGGTQLSGKTVGIIGCGHVGKKVALLLKAFGCKVIINDIIDISSFSKEHDFQIKDFEGTLKSCDIITLHTPLTPQTKLFVNKTSLSLMKKGTFVINTSRGMVINESDLIDTIKSGHLAGAGLDVYQQEPINKEALLHLDNVVLTPHIAGNAVEAVKAMGLAAIDGLEEFFNQ